MTRPNRSQRSQVELPQVGEYNRCIQVCVRKYRLYGITHSITRHDGVEKLPFLRAPESTFTELLIERLPSG